MRASILVALIVAVAACQTAAPVDGAAPTAAGVRSLMTPVAPADPPTRREAPDELRAAADPVGVFPVPEGSRFLRQAGHVGVYRLAAPFDKVVRFYRQAGFTVLDKASRASVYPPARSGAQELLVVRHLFGDVVQLIVYQGRGDE